MTKRVAASIRMLPGILHTLAELGHNQGRSLVDK
jgi:hypothetical protein